jgi:hypothetical protein
MPVISLVLCLPSTDKGENSIQRNAGEQVGSETRNVGFPNEGGL